jgi:hypothetical protein
MSGRMEENYERLQERYGAEKLQTLLVLLNELKTLKR